MTAGGGPRRMRLDRLEKGLAEFVKFFTKFSLSVARPGDFMLAAFRRVVL